MHRKAKEQFFNLDNKPTPNTDGYIAISYNYDDLGTLLNKTGHLADGSIKVIPTTE